MDLGLKDKTALVLGGGGGLGSVIAQTLAAEGAKIAIADVNAEAANNVAQGIQSTGAQAMGLVWDLADLAVIDANVGAIEKRLGPVDVLVNITGGPPPTPAAGQSPDLWSKNFPINGALGHCHYGSCAAKHEVAALGACHYQHLLRGSITDSQFGYFECAPPFAGRLVQDAVTRSGARRDYSQHRDPGPHRPDQSNPLPG